MANCILSFENYVFLSATSVNANGSEASGLSANRLKDSQVRKRWRSTLGDLTPSVDFDFAGSKSIDVVAWAQPVDAGGVDSDNIAQGFMSADDTVQHKFDLLSVGGGSVYDTGAIDSNIVSSMGVHAYVLPSTIVARFWRTTFNATSLAGNVNYIDMGLAWAGTKFVPERNMQYGYNWAFVDKSSVVNVQTSGLDFVRFGFKPRNVVFSFDSLSASDAQTISTLMRYVGTSRQILFIPDPDDVESDFAQPIIGRLVDSNPVALPTFGTYTKSFSLLQSL